MRVLFATYGFAGHLNSMVPLGWALRAAGHEVMVAAHPRLTGAITDAGLPALPVGPEFDLIAEVVGDAAEHGWFEAQRREIRETGAALTAAIRAPDGTVRPVRSGEPGARASGRFELPGTRPIVHSAEAMADDLLSFARAWEPDLVVYEPTGFAGVLVARLLGVPAVRALWTTDFTAPLRIFETELFGDLCARFGVDRLDVNGDLTLDPCPEALQVDDGLERLKMRNIPYNGRAVLPDWLREPPARRRVCVCWGVSWSAAPASRTFLAPEALRALSGLDAEVVMAVVESQRALLGDDLPANVTHVGPVALDLLLPTCDLIVHQGGGGIVMTALTHGVPQIIVPSMPDTAFNATHVARAGAGPTVWPDDGWAGTLRTTAAEVLDDPAYATTAHTLSAEMRTMPSPAEIVPVLEKLATEC